MKMSDVSLLSGNGCLEYPITPGKMKMRSLGRQAAPLPGSPRQRQQGFRDFLAEYSQGKEYHIMGVSS